MLPSSVAVIPTSQLIPVALWGFLTASRWRRDKPEPDLQINQIDLLTFSENIAATIQSHLGVTLKYSGEGKFPQ